MSRKLSTAQIDAMFHAYAEKQNDHYVSEKCGVSRAAVKRYRETEKWDERVAQLREKTAEKMNETLSSVRARQLKIVRAAIAGVIDTDTGKLRIAIANVGDLERLLKLELLLLGGVTERTETTEAGPDLSHLSDAQLEAEVTERLSVLTGRSGADAAAAGRDDQAARLN